MLRNNLALGLIFLLSLVFLPLLSLRAAERTEQFLQDVNPDVVMANRVQPLLVTARANIIPSIYSTGVAYAEENNSQFAQAGFDHDAAFAYLKRLNKRDSIGGFKSIYKKVLNDQNLLDKCDGDYRLLAGLAIGRSQLFGEQMLDHIKSRNVSIMFAPLPKGVVAFTLLNQNTNQQIIQVNNIYALTDPANYAQLFMHEALLGYSTSVNTPLACIQHALHTLAFIDWVSRHPEYAPVQTGLGQINTTEIVTLYESGSGLDIGLLDSNKNEPLFPNSVSPYDNVKNFLGAFFNPVF